MIKFLTIVLLLLISTISLGKDSPRCAYEVDTYKYAKDKKSKGTTKKYYSLPLEIKNSDREDVKYLITLEESIKNGLECNYTVKTIVKDKLIITQNALCTSRNNKKTKVDQSFFSLNDTDFKFWLRCAITSLPKSKDPEFFTYKSSDWVGLDSFGDKKGVGDTTCSFTDKRKARAWSKDIGFDKTLNNLTYGMRETLFEVDVFKGLKAYSTVTGEIRGGLDPTGYKKIETSVKLKNSKLYKFSLSGKCNCRNSDTEKASIEVFNSGKSKTIYLENKCVICVDPEG